MSTLNYSLDEGIEEMVDFDEDPWAGNEEANNKPQKQKEGKAAPLAISKRKAATAKSGIIKDRPKRSLSAYNLFFKQERKNMLAEREDGKPRRKVGFAEMAKTIGAKWKNISPEDKTHFEGLAARDKWRYNMEMGAFTKARQEEKARAAAAAAEAKAKPNSERKYQPAHEGPLQAESGEGVAAIDEIFSSQLDPSSFAAMSPQQQQQQQDQQVQPFPLHYNPQVSAHNDYTTSSNNQTDINLSSLIEYQHLISGAGGGSMNAALLPFTTTSRTAAGMPLLMQTLPNPIGSNFGTQLQQPNFATAVAGFPGLSSGTTQATPIDIDRRIVDRSSMIPSNMHGSTSGFIPNSIYVNNNSHMPSTSFPLSNSSAASFQRSNNNIRDMQHDPNPLHSASTTTTTTTTSAAAPSSSDNNIVEAERVRQLSNKLDGESIELLVKSFCR